MGTTNGVENAEDERQSLLAKNRNNDNNNNSDSSNNNKNNNSNNTITESPNKNTKNNNNNILLSRRIARFFSKHFPSIYGKNGNIDAAWDYFEQITLPRRMYNHETNEYVMAPKGISSSISELYPAWTTPTSELADFGTGIAVYFDTMRTLVILMFISGLLYTPTFWYYYHSSGQYNNNNNNNHFDAEDYIKSMNPFLSGSMMCNHTTWVPCIDCTFEEWKDSPHRMAFAYTNTDPTITSIMEEENEFTMTTTPTDNFEINDKGHALLWFVLKNSCAPLRWQEGLNHLVVIVFWIVAFCGLYYHQTTMERQFDEAKLTASDYSIQIDNPPLDANDPDEWKHYFENMTFSGGDGDGGDTFKVKVAYVTVALHNEDFVDTLVKRRILLQKLSFKLLNRTNDETPLQTLPDDFEKTHSKHYKKLAKLEESCQKYLGMRNENDDATKTATTPNNDDNANNKKMKRDRLFDVSAVFVTFETERMQRQVLEALTVGSFDTVTNNLQKFSSESTSKYLFRGNLVLNVFEAVEPSAIRWQDLDETILIKIIQRIFTYSLTIVIIYLGFITVRHGFEQGSTFAAFEIVLLNILVPKVLRLINLLEAHRHEGSFQASLYIKVAAFRWINTAIITIFVKPLMATIEAPNPNIHVSATPLIPSVYAVLKAEIITVPTLHMLDIMGNIKRHVLAPFRSANQAAMNSYFGGAPGFLGEKYTAITKIVFLCFFYAVIFPSSFFFGSAALFMTYITEKFNLMRSWAPMPELGDEVAWISRHIFLPLAVFALAIMSEFYWSAYPFDNLCDTDQTVGDRDDFSKYLGTHTITTMGGGGKGGGEDYSSSFQITIDPNNDVYKYCNQDFLERTGILFSFFVEEKDDWMTSDQMILTFTFGLVCAVTLAILTIFLCHGGIIPCIHQAIGKKFTTEEVDSGQKYSDQQHINAYVPQVRHPKFPYPLLSCDISNVIPNHIGWFDPMRNHSYYDMSEDVRILLRKNNMNGNKNNNISQNDIVMTDGRGPALSIVKHYYSSSETELLMKKFPISSTNITTDEEGEADAACTTTTTTDAGYGSVANDANDGN